MAEIQSFDPTVPQDEVDRLFRKLRDARLPKNPIVPDAGDDYGVIFAEVEYDTELNCSRSFAGMDQQTVRLLAE